MKNALESNDLQSSLEEINTISRLLLTQLELQLETVDITPDSSTKSEQILLTNEQLLSLVSQRTTLITQLFDSYTQDKLSLELTLINEMVLLDKQLTAKSLNNKKVLGDKVIKLKKSQKVSKIYKQY